MPLPDVRLGGPVEDAHPVRVRPPRTGPVGPETTDLVGPDGPGLDLPGPGDETGRSMPQRTAIADRVPYLLQYVADLLGDAMRKTGSHKGGFGDARLESWNQFQTRVQARAWLPDGYDGKFLIVAPAVFYYTVGAAGWTVGHAIVWLCTHMLAFTIAFLLAAAVTVLWLIFG